MKKALGLSLLSVAMMSLGSASAAKITVWTHFEGPELAWLKDQATAFERATKNDVDIVSVPFGTIQDKFIQSAPRGQGADLLVSQPHDRLGAFAAAGVIEPLDKYITSRTDLSKIALSTMTYKGRLFGLPMFAEAVGVVYNKKLVKSVPTNWNDFIKVAQANTGNGRFGFLYDIANAYYNYGIINAYGGYVFKNNNGTLDVKNLGIANDGAEKAASLLNDLRYKYNLVPEGLDDQAARSAFLDGRLAMYLTGPWNMGDIKKAGIDYGIAPLPTPPGATSKWSPFVGVQGIMLSAYSKNKTVAAQFARQLVTSDAQVSFNKAGGRLPVSLSATTRLKSDPVVAGFGKNINLGTPMPNVAEMGAVWGPWSNANAQSVAKPNANFKQILDAAQKEISANIK
ncbi:maltose ABC transporter substrate-binding protein [Deinococcus yavapaiensis]|uniref:Carbohydrate ABC transporter substrate-binding protein (CUT1 family) n=1 Tax=Deinococcus yavapaiensis KR-236 TaxID=694435 RepID=A0A318SBT0_9DEIO|nr:maltose ABC transporter substrate-binding protein [Deinococcus yavapaiensis]PYE56508.1 carbohydrate ABC transporter substrate-binding protein (CUT1 family) [Deinococcus yavapaiensis KR-236]